MFPSIDYWAALSLSFRRISNVNEHNSLGSPGNQKRAAINQILWPLLNTQPTPFHMHGFSVIITCVMQSGQACNSLPKMLSDEQLCMKLLLHNLTTLLQWWDHGAPATGLFLIWPNGVHQWATIIMCYSWTLSFSVYSRFLHRVVFCTDLFSVIKVWTSLVSFATVNVFQCCKSLASWGSRI